MANFTFLANFRFLTLDTIYFIQFDFYSGCLYVAKDRNPFDNCQYNGENAI